jgi:D-aspartate ligase
MLSLDNPRDAPRIRERLRRLNATGVSLPPAVVAGTSINALGVVRALGAEGIPVIWLTSNPQSFVTYSRFSSCNIACKDAFHDDFVPAMLKLGKLLQSKAVLFVTHDLQVEAVSTRRQDLMENYLFLLPEHETIKAMINKKMFHDIASESDLRVAETYVINRAEDLTDLYAHHLYHGIWVVKPLQKNDDFESFFGKAIRVNCREQWSDLERAYRCWGEKEILIQRWIPGSDGDVVFCLVVFNQEARCTGSFCGRKIRQYKPDVGNTASAEKFISPEITAETIRFFSRHQFRGMGSMEFKYESNDKVYYAIEPTVGRTDLQSELAVINGCNLPAIYYFGLIGDTKREQEKATLAECASGNRIWIRFGVDFKAAWFYWKSGRLRVRIWLMSLLRPMAFSLFRLNDPIPFLAFLKSTGVSLLKHSCKQMISVLRDRASEQQSA